MHLRRVWLAAAGALLGLAVVIGWLTLAHAQVRSPTTPPTRRPARARIRAHDPSHQASSYVKPALAPPSRRGSQADALSLTELAGERVVYAYSGTVPPPALISAIRAGEAAGVILFAPNIESDDQIRLVISQLQQAALASPVRRRLLILTDQEGGEVRRLPGQPLLL